MAQYIIRRVLWSIPVLIAVSLITFILMHLIPGGPWDADHSSRPISSEVQNTLTVQYGLDKPLLTQYLIYMGNVLHGDLGISYDDSRTVNQIIASEFPLSAAFGAAALLIGVAIGIPFGVISALKHHTWLDQVGTYLITAIIAIPNFVLAIALIFLLAVNLHLFSVQYQRDQWSSWILPVTLLAARIFALVARFVRAGVLDILGSDFIRTAHAKGLTARIIYFGHILRNALLPIVTLLGPLAADVLTGSFIIETIFGIPGLGSAFVNSIVFRDYPLLMGVTLFYAFLLIFFNLLVDLSYPMIDPRIVYR